MSEQKIVGVQLSSGGKTYDFYAPAEWDLPLNTQVVVNTVRGRQIGRVLKLGGEGAAPEDELQSIERIATEEDLARKAALAEKEKEAVEKVAEFLRHSHYQDVKIIDAEYSLDMARISLYLNYDAETSFDIKSFLRETSHLFRESRIDVRQVGPRDMAKAMSGLGACGIEKRCCSRFLKDFNSISIKMAKAQDVSLTPDEITGICGRLRCCLAYEYPQYAEALAVLPKKKKMIKTPLGEGKVVNLIPLSETVIVNIPEMGLRKFTRTELETGVMNEASPSTQSELVEHDLEHSSDVEILQLAPVPERREHTPRRDRGRDQRSKRGDRRGQNGETAESRKNQGQDNHTEKQQRRTFNKDRSQQNETQSASAVGEKQTAGQEQPDQDQDRPVRHERYDRPKRRGRNQGRRQNANHSDTETATANSETKSSGVKPRSERHHERPRREWIKKS